MFITGFVCVCVWFMYFTIYFLLIQTKRISLKKARKLQERVGLALSTSELAIQIKNTVFKFKTVDRFKNVPP